MDKFKGIVLKYIEDMLIFSGLFIFITTTFVLNKFLGFYLLSVVLIVIGVILSRTLWR